MNEGDSRCQGRRKMTGSEEDNGGVTEEKPGAAPAVLPEKSPEKGESVGLGLDLYTQAFKVLSERSPFDSEEVLANTSATLPSGLASLLKNTDSRRKHKRHHADTKSSRKSSEKSKNSNIWVELEGYFRELKVQDIERLFRFSSSLECSNSCFEIPVVGNVARIDDDNIKKVDNSHAEVAVTAEEVVVVDNVVKKENGRAENRVPDSATVEVVDEEVEKESEDQQVNLEENESRDRVGERGSVPESSTQSCSSIEWVLGSRNRVLLTTTRPSKKRKLVGENAGLERLIVARPCEGQSSLCHVCSMGDTGDQLNQLVVCSLCKVAVHQKCYGVQGEVDESWMCSWCKHKSKVEAGQPSSSDQPCVLCPKPGGASKRFKRAGNEGSIEFAHLFCSQWMPEIYIEDTRLMEPLISLDRAKDVRGKALCTLCKSKLGCCVRCSDGLCKTPVHPICAREAGNKLEIWGKFGCDDIELRAFCSRHSGDGGVADSGTLEKNEQSHASVGGGTPAVTDQQGNKIRKLKIGCKNGDKVTFHIGAADDSTNAVRDEESQDLRLKDMINMKHRSGSGGQQDLSEVQHSGQKFIEAVRTSSVDVGVILKKLLDRGKVNLQQVASGIGITEDYLETKLTDNCLGPEMSGRILKWLKDHAHVGTSEKHMRAKIRCLMSPKCESGTDGSSDSVAVIDSDMPDVVPVKSVPPRRRTVGSIVKEDKTAPLWNEKQFGNDESVNEGIEHEHVSGGHDCLSEDSISDVGKIMVETTGFDHPLVEPSPTSESTLHKLSSPLDNELNRVEVTTTSREGSVLGLGQEPPSCSYVNTVGSFDGYVKPRTNTFVHPYIQKKLGEVQSWLVKKAPSDCNGVDSIARNRLPTALVSPEHKLHDVEQNNGVKLEDLHLAAEMGVLDLTPQDELEGEIIYSQQWWLHNAVALKHHADQLVCKVIRSVPREINSVRKQRWDDVHVNQYIHELKEARKQGRKERRHKEAQAVLAAATAAAAASSRMSSLRKDSVDETPQQENQLMLESSRLRGSLSSLSVSRTKEFNSALDVPTAISDRYPDMFQYASGSPKEHLKSCDICRRTESLLNPVLVCLSCKVAVHLNCYRSVKESTGPWYCELCEDSSASKASRSAVEKPSPIAECGFCGASNGAFRKSSNGQWVHAFCAEWVFDSTFRRGQVYPVTGMDAVLKGSDICSVCHRRFGVCIKCNYGNCQSTFHPSCARSAGYYMYTKYIGGGKIQHKAYCSKHSLEQRAKVETQKHGVEDLKVVKQHRVELEKLRLLCERIVKREKLKRELVLCNHDILASKQESLAISMLVRPPFLSQEVSSESATTSLRAHSRSYSEAMQKSDDVTVDSALSSKRCIRFPLSVDTEQRTDDSSTSQRTSTPKPPERVTFAGKQIPVRAPMASRNILPGGEQMSKSKKNTEIFEKELVMTSDQASMRNRQLPKGYFYVPRDSLSNGKPVSQDTVEREEVDG